MYNLRILWVILYTFALIVGAWASDHLLHDYAAPVHLLTFAGSIILALIATALLLKSD